MKKENLFLLITIIVSVVLVVGAVFGLSSFSKNKSEIETQETVSRDILLRDGAPEKGNPQAQVIVVEFSDFQCPACQYASTQIPALLDQYPDKIRFVYRYFPLSGHKNAVPAAKAGQAALLQGKFWEMHDLLFARQQDWETKNNPKDIFVGYAQELGLNVDQFTSDFDSPATADLIAQDTAAGVQAKVQATPTFYVNGAAVSGFNLKTLQTLIDEQLNLVDSMQGLMQASDEAMASAAASPSSGNSLESVEITR